MFRSRRQLRAGKVSARILDYGNRYARFVGFFWFVIEVNPRNGSLVARNHFWHKRFCLLMRLVMYFCFFYINVKRILNATGQNFIIYYLFIICWVILCLNILIMQLWFGQRVVRVVNDFLRLFRRVKALPGCQDIGFGGIRELTLLILKVICVCYEIPFLLLWFNSTFEIIIEIYTTINATLMLHTCFVAFLSIGALYGQMNRYIRRQLRSAKQPNCEEELKSAEYRLDQCVAIYDEIQRVSDSFQKLMDLPIFLMLLVMFVTLTIISYNVVSSGFRSGVLWLNVVKMFTDLLLFILAVDGASANSRVIQRLKLENCYQSKSWHMRMEMFLSRLNFYEFRVRPLGLFEVSNELLLVYFSAVVTYLTYIMQYRMQMY